jgi:hypothetical protein
MMEPRLHGCTCGAKLARQQHFLLVMFMVRQQEDRSQAKLRNMVGCLELGEVRSGWVDQK